MATRISELLNITHDDLLNEDAFDGFVEIDSQFYIDPSLLESVKVPELKNSYGKIQKYFENVITLLAASEKPNDIFRRKSIKLLKFKEINEIGLGYAKSSTYGNAIGLRLASNIVDTAYQIVSAGIKDPIIFELIGLFEEYIGADRISDMTARIILTDLLSYSDRVSNSLKIEELIKVRLNDNEYSLPYNKYASKPLILIPNSILTPLPVAYDWDDISYVCSHNAALRARVNKIIGDTWRQATRRISKPILKSYLLREPELLIDLINQYRNKPSVKYDFNLDPYGELKWHDEAQTFTKLFPLDLIRYRYVTPQNVVEVVGKICEQYRILVENKGLNESLYYNNKLLKEKYPQRLFYAVADCYCKANNLDLSPEPNAGRGSVDFKISHGYKGKVIVELKYSKNDIIGGYQKQLKAYNDAEEAYSSYYLIIQVTKTSRNIKKLQKIQEKDINDNKQVPEIIIVDGRRKPSASKL